LIGLVSRLLDFIGGHATWFLGAGVLTGLLVPPLATLVAPLLVPTLLIPLALALVRLDWCAFRVYAGRPLLVAALVAWLLGISPVLVWATLAPLDMAPALRQALVLAAASSPIVSCAAISLILGLDAALAVVVVLLSTALVPITLPPLALALLGLKLQIDLSAFMLRLGLLVGATFSAALAIRALVPGRVLERHARTLDGIAVINMVLFAIAIMHGVTAFAMERPWFVLTVTVAAFAANALLQALGTAVFWRLGPRAALTAGLMTGNCNLGLVMVGLGPQAGIDLVVFFAMGQLPMYMLPGLLLPVYRRVLAAGVRRKEYG
jgi:BASS family bile acid:Na+ symporter